MEKGSITRSRLQRYIGLGRRVIEYSILYAIIRPRALTSGDEAEIAELSGLLNRYNRLMALLVQPREFRPAANDPSFEGDKR